MAVLTNKPDMAAGPMVELYYPGVFHTVQGALPDMPTKPDPTLLFRLMEKLGAKREETLFVGDSNVDVKTAQAAGVKCLSVLWGFQDEEDIRAAGATHFCLNPKDLPTMLKEMIE